jgi:hypothetical protein
LMSFMIYWMNSEALSRKGIQMLTLANQSVAAAPLGSRAVRIILQRLLQPNGRFRRQSLSSGQMPLLPAA